MFVTVISRTLAGVYRSDCLASARPKSTIEQRAVRFQSGLNDTELKSYKRLSRKMCYGTSGIISGMYSAYKRRRYNEILTLIGWASNLNGPWL